MPSPKPPKTELEEAAELMQQPDTVVGYQYSPVDGAFLGEYTFPNNKDKFEVHLPPNTTLEAPPANANKKKRPYFRNGAWVLDDDSFKLKHIQVPDPDAPLRLQVPLLVRRTRMEKPNKDSAAVEVEYYEWEAVTTTVEQERQNAAQVRQAFLEQKRLFGLEEEA